MIDLAELSKRKPDVRGDVELTPEERDILVNVAREMISLGTGEMAWTREEIANLYGITDSAHRDEDPEEE